MGLDFFLSFTEIYQLIRDCFYNMHGRHDAYLAEELEQEIHRQKVPVKKRIKVRHNRFEKIPSNIVIGSC